MIVLRVLGELSLTASDGRELRSILAQPKRLALLAYLASPRTPEFVARGVLLGLFWPERDQQRARHALRTSLHFLRRSLGRDVLVSRGDHEVGLDPLRLRCDATVLVAALDAGAYERALDLYGGDYLPGLRVDDAPEFERWLEGERRWLRLRIRDAARRLTEAALARADGEEAERRVRRAAALDPWDESTLRLLMRVLTERGNRAGALRAYDRFTARLCDELRLEPSPETRALATRIRSGWGAPGPQEPDAPDGREAPARIAGPAPGTAPGPSRPERPVATGAASTGGGKSSPPFIRRLPWAAAALLLLAAGAILAHRPARPDPSPAPGAVDDLTTERTRSIAVLPLDNLSPDSSDAYFAGAMTDELTSALSVVPGFQVVSRTSASKFGGPRDVGARRIADSLGVRYLVEGSVLRTGDSLDIATRLVDGRRDRTLWSGRFSRPAREALDIQIEIARQIAASLRSSFTRTEEERFEAGQTQDPVARDLYFRAKNLLEPTTLLDSVTAARGVRLLRQAVALDSSFAAAWYWLGVGFRWERWVPHNSDSSRMAYDRAIRHARSPWLRAEYRALRAERLSERDSALMFARRAVRLNPGDPGLLWNLSQAFKWKEDLPDALVWERKARDLDPLNPARWRALGTTYTGLYLDQRAERAIRRAIAIDSSDPDGWGALIRLRLFQGRYRAALALQDTAGALTGIPDDPVLRGQVFLWTGQTKRARTVLEGALRTRPWTDMVWAAPEIVRARLLTGDTAGADSLARRAQATFRRIAIDFRMSPGMPFALVDLAAVRGRGAEAAKRLRDYVKLATELPFRYFLEDPDYGAVLSDTAFQDALGEVRRRVMSQRREALRILASGDPR